MELLQLRYFQTAAKTQNFSKAAEELNISQPSLSITISRLEYELNAKLFDRKGRNVVLNEAGIVFLNRVNKVFCELESAKNEISNISGKQSKNISIAITSPRLLSGVLKAYLEQYNDVVINQRCEIYENAKKLLLSGEIDFCLTVPAISDENIECKILKEDELVLVVPNSHKFAEQSSIHLSEMSEEYFITLIHNYNFRIITDSICQAAGFSPKIAFEVDDMLMEEMLELKRGIAILPLYMIKRHHAGIRNLSMVKIDDPDAHMTIGLSWLRNKYFSDTAKCFRDYMIQNYINYFC
jgi:LysR family transcriptional activator of glutamate synthase operon